MNGSPRDKAHTSGDGVRGVDRTGRHEKPTGGAALGGRRSVAIIVVVAALVWIGGTVTALVWRDNAFLSAVSVAGTIAGPISMLFALVAVVRQTRRDDAADEVLERRLLDLSDDISAKVDEMRELLRAMTDLSRTLAGQNEKLQDYTLDQLRQRDEPAPEPPALADRVVAALARRRCKSDHIARELGAPQDAVIEALDAIEPKLLYDESDNTYRLP